MPPMIQVDTLAYAAFTLDKPPLYGCFLRLFSPVSAVIVQHLLVLCAALILYATVRSAANRQAGLAAGLLVAAYPGFVLAGNELMSESLFLFLLALHLGVLWLAICRKSAWWFFFAGATAGLAANVRAVFQQQALVVALGLAPLFVARRDLKRFAALVAALFGGFLVVCVPTVARVYLLTGRCVPLSTIFPNVLILRMLTEQDAPVAEVPVDNAVLAALRDYLSGLGKTDPALLHAHPLGYICANILPSGRNSEAIASSYVVSLWKLYVRHFPAAYLRHSCQLLLSNLAFREDWIGAYLFSRDTLARDWVFEGPNKEDYRAELSRLKQPSMDALASLDAFYNLVGSLFLFGPALILIVLALDFIIVLVPKIAMATAGGRRWLASASAETAGLFLPGGTVRAYWLIAYATATFTYVPIFLINESVWRFRLPFDLVFFLVLGRVFARVRDAIAMFARRVTAKPRRLPVGER
jgi:hypothetical protein